MKRSSKRDDAVQSFLRDLQHKHQQQQSSRKRRNHSDASKSEKTSRKRHKDETTTTKRLHTVVEDPTSTSTDSLPKKLSMKQRTETSVHPAAATAAAILTRRPPVIPSNINNNSKTTGPLKFDHCYILAPMVGASDLPFRLLCRKYGTQLAYTPMMSAHQFAHDPAYRHATFQTLPNDRPLVCHFSANTPADFAAAAVAAEPYCDAIDLNLGCPQRTAHVGHFGSYLLDEPDRPLICAMIQAAAAAVAIPICCKIRLLATLDETIRLVEQLADAGASLVAIHARYRASWERHSAGARDGPAFLDQVAAVRQAMVARGKTAVHIVTNGNTITWQDVVDNLESTRAHGIMSAEGLLDNPALFLARLGSIEDNGDTMVRVLQYGAASNVVEDEKTEQKKQKLLKKMRAIERIEETIKSKGTDADLTEKKREKLASKPVVTKKIAKLQTRSTENLDESPSFTTVPLRDLYQAASDPLNLAKEYVDLATQYPVPLRSVIFHVRRMLKRPLEQYQLLEECLSCPSVDHVRGILQRIDSYRACPDSFVFDQRKAQHEKEALERKRAEEGKRKAYEARMMRKAKREGKTDVTHYLRMGAQVPTKKVVKQLKGLPRHEAMQLWKEKHSQRCLAFHLDEGGCKRGRACAFLHVDCVGSNSFVEKDEVAG